MLTNIVRIKLCRDYGIRDIPAELLEYFVTKKRRMLSPETIALSSTIAFLIAYDWQRGRTVAAI